MDTETEHIHLGLRLAERYRLTKDVATGSLCAVYGGEDLMLERPIIVKAVAPRALPLYAEALERTAALTHPAVIATYDAIEHEGWLFVVQEFLPHRALTSYLANGVPSLRAVDLLLQLARLLAYTHDQGVVHGDLRPDAVLVDRTARLHVNNFCLPGDPVYVRILAEQLAFAASREHQTALEPVLPDLTTPAGDVWAAGALIWQLLSVPTHDAPPGEAPGAWRVMRDDVPEALGRLVRRCCYPGEPEPIQTAFALVEACATVRDAMRANQPATLPPTPPGLLALRDGLPLTDPLSPFGRPVPRDPMVVGGRASNSVFNAPTDSIYVDAAQTHPADSAFLAEGRATPSRPMGPPRLSLPSRYIDDPLSPFASDPPLWDSPRRQTIPRDPPSRRGQVGLVEVLALGGVLFIIFFVLGFLWLGPAVLPR